MSQQLSLDDARQSLRAHLAAKGADIRAKYGPIIGWNELLHILDDRECVRYPCRIQFDSQTLQPGELAYPLPLGATPEEGFVIHVHPRFANRLDEVPWLVLYQLVVVNYGAFASADDAEAFGAAILGIAVDDYYRELCKMADEAG
jgi:hypothetical protein